MPEEACGPAAGTAANLAESIAHLPSQPAQTVGPGIESAPSAEPRPRDAYTLSASDTELTQR